jgi:hypothetical protein
VGVLQLSQHGVVVMLFLLFLLGIGSPVQPRSHLVQAQNMPIMETLHKQNLWYKLMTLAKVRQSAKQTGRQAGTQKNVTRTFKVK